MVKADNRGLSHLRHLVHDPPRGDRTTQWRRVCAALEELSPGVLGLGLEYVRHHVEGWPVEFLQHRCSVAEWVEAPPVWWSLVRHLVIAQHQVSEDEVRALASAPTIARVTSLSLRDCRMGDLGLEALAQAHASLGHLTHLDVGGGNRIGFDGVAALAKSPLLANLHALDFGVRANWNGEHNALGVEEARLLAQSPFVSKLRSLDLRGNQLGDEGLAELAYSPHLRSLSRLVLWSNRIEGVEGLAVLADSTAHSWYGLPRLEMLDISHNVFGDAGISELARANLTHLHELDTANCGVGAAGARALAEATLLSTLTTLDLRRNPIGDDGAEALARSSTLTQPREVLLADCQIGDRGAEALAQAPWLAGVNHISLDDNQIGDLGASALARSPQLMSYGPLSLMSNQIGDEGAVAFSQSDRLARTTEFMLAYNLIGDRGAQALAQSPHASGLRQLHLAENRIGDEGARALAASPHLAGGLYLSLDGNPIGGEGKRALAAGRFLLDDL